MKGKSVVTVLSIMTVSLRK